MRLVSVSANVFVNPECISCIEQRIIEGTAVTYVWIEDKSYVLTVPFEDFYRNIQQTDEKPIQQIWAG